MPHEKDTPHDLDGLTGPVISHAVGTGSARRRPAPALWKRTRNPRKPALKSCAANENAIQLNFTPKELKLLALALAELENDLYLSPLKEAQRQELADRIARALREVQRQLIGFKMMKPR